jgi:hypothetical protein
MTLPDVPAQWMALLQGIKISSNVDRGSGCKRNAAINLVKIVVYKLTHIWV